MNDLRERLDHLAEAGATGIELRSPVGPDSAGVSWPHRPGGSRPNRRVAAVLAAVLIVVTAGAALVLRSHDGPGRTTIGTAPSARGTASRPSAAPGGAVVAVTYGPNGAAVASAVVQPVELRISFVDPGSGREIAARRWDEVYEEGVDLGGQVVVTDGLVQRVPAGDLQVEVAMRQADGWASCTQRLRPAEGDRLVLRVEDGRLGGRSIRHGVHVPCAPVQTVEEWVQDETSPTGVPYVGLTRTAAEARAAIEGLTTRVIATNGMEVSATREPQPQRLELVLFDGIVVAAQLDGEEPLADPPELPPAD